MRTACEFQVPWMAVNFKIPVLISKMNIFCIVLLVLVDIYGCYGAKLSVPRILLPFNTGVPTNYTLEVKEGGCYKWSSSRHDLVTVTPLPNERERASCTTKALVSAISRYSERENAIILAEDEKSSQVLRCDVVIDSIHSIEIITTTRVLFLEDAPEAFEVVAKNGQGDQFSSLAGVAFQWSLESDSLVNDAYGVLRFLKFADSAYKTPTTIEYWEKQNLHGSVILMEGSKTGSAKVSVKPLDSAYKNVASYEVSLVVVANLNLKPAHIYVLPGSKVKYNLELIKQGKAFPISLPSEQYYLEVVNQNIVSLDGSVVTALTYGTSNIVVKDKYVTARELAYLPSAVIHVAHPSYLTLSVSPGEKWTLEENKDYSVSVALYDRNSHPIHIDKDMRVSVVFPSKYFQVKKSSVNGTFHEIKTLSPGSCEIKAQLLGIANQDGSIRSIEGLITHTQDVIIYESIKVHPAQTLLPWDPVSEPSYSVLLKATGGTGTYNWKSGDSSLASVNAFYEEEETIARVTTFGQGSFKVYATDAHIPSFSGSGDVSVLPVVDLEILPDKIEVELNDTLVLPVSMFGLMPDNSAKRFSNCSEIPIIVDIDEIQKFSLTTDVTSMPKPPACRNIHLTCVSKGFNRIRVKYQREDLSLKKAVIAACYRKLKVMKPGNEVVLAVGSSYEILFEGGPRPWPRCPTHYINLVQKHKFLDVSVLRNSSDLSDTHKVPTFCKGYGENTLKLEVGNKPCDSNPHPAVSQSSIKVFCSVPESLTLKPVIQGKFASKEKISKKCPVTGDDRIAIHSARPLNIELIVKDSFGREFHNISSLDIQWTLSNPSLASLSNSAQISLNAQLKSRYYQELHPHGFEGILKVTASILGYQSNLQNVDGGINEEHFSINSSLNFLLVEEAIVQPKKLSVFNSPSNKVYFNVSKGSGHFQVEVSDGIKAKAVYLSATRQIEVTPQETGSITITLHDLCLGIIHESVAEIEIYGISAVVVHVVDKVQLGKSITAVVEVLNEDNEQIPASVFSLMNLQAVSQSDIISIRLASKPEPHQYQALYNINGVFLGQTSFKIITQANIFKGVQYSSESYPIQVFSPLRLNPRHVVLIVGGTFQVLCSGGPQPQTNIEYLLDDKEIAVVSVAGIVEAKKIGTTTLTARSVGVDRKDKAVVYSEDKIIVSCISLKEIKIHSPLSRMVAGAEMPLHAFGLTEDENPFAFGTAYPTAQFKWTVSNDKVASLYNMYSSIGLQESSENNFRVGIKAHQDGLVTVHLEVSLAKELSFFGSSRVLSSEIQIQVFKKLKLINPEVEDGMILMSLNSQLKLKCNRFGTAKVIYEILPSSGQEAPTVTSDGNLIASSKPGSAILLVTAVEDFDVTQRLSVIVRVEEVAYMMLKPVGKILTREWPLTVLPIGFTIPFHVSYHDNIGLPFDAVRSQLQFRASRHNSARVSFGTLNNTLSVQVVKPGFTVLKVWEKDMSIPPDYIKIGTGTAIDPADVHLTVGDVVCFGSPLVTQEGHGGSWASSKSVLAIHSLSGGAVALGPGQATVIYSLLNGFSTSSQVTIQDAAYISIEPSNVNQISNLPRIKPYKVYLVIQSNETHKDNNIVGKNCSHATESSMPLPLVQPPFSCELNFLSSSVDISVNDIFQSAGGFDIEKGMYYCSIEPVNKISASDASILEGQVSLTVHLDSMGQASSLSQQLLLSFMPAFYVQQDELVLSDVQNTNQLVISATPAVQRCIKVTPSDQTVLRVKSPVKNSVFPASVSFPVELHDINYLWKGDMSPLYLEISCPITKQLVKVPIKVKRLELSLDGTGYCAPPPLPAVTDFIYDWYLIAKVTVAVIVFILFIYIMRCFSSARRGVVTSQPVFLSSSSSFDGSKSFSPVHSPFRQRFSPSPTGEYENLSGPLRLCSLEATPPSVTRRRTENIFR